MIYLLYDSWVVSKFLEYERLDRIVEVDLFYKSSSLEVNRLLENDSRSDIFNSTYRSDIFYTILTSCERYREI
jgi:hypothetical protein